MHFRENSRWHAFYSFSLLTGAYGRLHRTALSVYSKCWPGRLISPHLIQKPSTPVATVVTTSQTPGACYFSPQIYSSTYQARYTFTYPKTRETSSLCDWAEAHREVMKDGCSSRGFWQSGRPSGLTDSPALKATGVRPRCSPLVEGTFSTQKCHLLILNFCRTYSFPTKF